MKLYLATVTEIIDDAKFSIKFSIPNLIEDGVAYATDGGDKPRVGDPIVIFELDEIFNHSFIYMKLRVLDHTLFTYKNQNIKLYEDGIQIEAVDADGNFKNKIQLLSTDGNINIESSGNVNLTANKVNFDVSGGDGEWIREIAVKVPMGTTFTIAGTVAGAPVTGTGTMSADVPCTVSYTRNSNVQIKEV